jgi:DNA-binding NtrC family response regulator
VQEIIARSLAERRAPWERADAIDVQLALTAAVPPQKLVDEGRLTSVLAMRLADALVAPVYLPRLSERAEDLRSIVTDRLAREGLRVLGRPVGIEHAAFARIVDHAFPGEVAELAALVQRLVAVCASAGRDVVVAADVESLRLGPSVGEGRQKDPISA